MTNSHNQVHSNCLKTHFDIRLFSNYFKLPRTCLFLFAEGLRPLVPKPDGWLQLRCVLLQQSARCAGFQCWSAKPSTATPTVLFWRLKKLQKDAAKVLLLMEFSFIVCVPVFLGVDVCIRDFNRRNIRIRESRRVKVGHIATGISDQVRPRRFSWPIVLF